MSENLQLGLGIQFDSSTLNQLNAILKYVQEIQKKFETMGDVAKKPQQAVVDLNAKFQELGLTTAKVVKEVENVGKSITKSMDTGHGKLAQVTQDIDGSVSKIKLMDNGFRSMGETMVQNISKFAEWTLAAGALFTVINGIKDAVKVMKDFESSNIKVQRVLPQNSDMGVIDKGAASIAQSYGESLTDTMSAMEGWSRKFKEVNDVVSMTDQSLRLVAVTDIDLESSFKDLSAIMQQFGLNTSYAGKAVDSLNEMSNNMRTTSQDVAEGLSKMGSSARLMGVDFDHATALVAAGVEATGASGSVIGTSLNRMLARLHSVAAVTQLKGIGINAYDPNGGKILDELGEKWKTLTTIQQENIAKALGGVVQYQKIMSILGNYDRVVYATSLSVNSLGSAEKEIQMDMSTLDKKLAQLNASWQVFVTGLNGGLPIFKYFIDGLRELIVFADGWVIKSALIAAAVYGIVIAFQAWQSASLAVSTTGVIGLIVAGASLTAMLIGWIKSMNQATTATNNMISPSSSLLKSYTSLNSQLKSMTPATDQYKQKQQELQEKMNQIAKTYPSVVTAYDNLGNARIIDLQLLQQQINKENELMRIRNQSAREGVNNQIAKVWSDQKKAQQELTSMQNNPTQWKRDWRADMRVGNSGLSEAELVKLSNMNYNTTLGDLATKIRKDEEMRNQLHDQRNSIDGIAKKTSVITPDLNSNDMGDILDLGQEKLENKIQKIIDTYQDEMIAIRNTSDAFTQQGISYDIVKAKIDATNAALSAMARIAPDNSWIKEWATDLALLKPDEIINQFNEKMKGLDEQFNASGNQIQYYAEQIKLLQTTIKVLGTTDPDNKKLEEYKDTLKDLNEELAKQKQIQKEGQKRLDQSDAELKKLGWDNYTPGFDEKKAKLVTTTLDAVSSALANLGTVAGNVLSSLTSSMSKNFNTTNAGGFDWGKIGSDMQNAGMQQGIDMMIKGVTQLTSGNKQSNKMEDSNYSVSELFKNFKSYDDNLKQYNDLRKQQGMDEAVGGAGMAIGAIIAASNPIGWVIMAIGAIFGSMGESLQDQINSLGEKLTATWGKIKEALGTSVEDLGNLIGNAFQADTYSGFLTNFSQSLYTMTRQGLIKAFMASEAFQPLYKNLTDVITASVMDGSISADEILAIKNASNALAPQMQALYQSLNLLGTSMPGGSSGSSSSGAASYTAGNSTPIIYNNYINIQSEAFIGDKDTARTFALWMLDIMEEEKSRS